jgi:hypothetical protein
MNWRMLRQDAFTPLGHESGSVLKALAFALALLLCGLLVWQALRLSQHQAAANNSLASIKQLATPVAPKPAPRVASSALSEDTKQGLNRAIQLLNTPWPLALSEIEAATPKDVAVLELEPEDKGLRIQVEAMGADKLLRYASGLHQRGVFGTMVLGRQEVNDKDPNQPTRLTFNVEVIQRP